MPQWNFVLIFVFNIILDDTCVFDIFTCLCHLRLPPALNCTIDYALLLFDYLTIILYVRL